MMTVECGQSGGRNRIAASGGLLHCRTKIDFRAKTEYTKTQIDKDTAQNIQTLSLMVLYGKRPKKGNQDFKSK